MLKATEAISREQRERIEAAVAAAEAKTSCEIVPVVATASGRYDRAEDVFGLWFAVVGAAAVWLILPRQDDPGAWNGVPVWGEVLVLALTIFGCFIAGCAAASRVAAIRRLFTPRQQMVEEVNIAARRLFFDRRVHHTTGASGLLIFVSLYEHIAVVLGDRSVVDNLGQSFLDGLCERLTADLKNGEFADAICDVTQYAEAALEAALPRSSSDVNELPNSLILID
jgi:putative membrane protein